MATLLPAVHVGLAESEVGVSAACWGFIRSFGGIWGSTIPAAILNSQFQSQLVRRRKLISRYEMQSRSTGKDLFVKG
jgi:hypothetical protein